MIYCVIPPELADELYDKLVEHYRENPNVQVIVDRRVRDRRSGEDASDLSDEVRERRQTRDRRRARPGTFPSVHEPASGDSHAEAR